MGGFFLTHTVEQTTVGCLVLTNHNKAAVRGLVSRPITAYVGHLCWQLSVASLAVASGTAVTLTIISVVPQCTNHHLHVAV